MSGTKAKWIKVTQAVTTKTTFDKRAKEKDYFKSSTSICEDSYNELQIPYSPKNVDDKMQESAMRLIWTISNCHKVSTKKKDFLISRELVTIQTDNGEDFLKDMLVHICELDHPELLKQGVPVVELCGKCARFLAIKTTVTSSGSNSSSGSSKGSNASQEKSPTNIQRFKINSDKCIPTINVTLTSGLSPKRKKAKTILDKDTVAKKRKPGAFNLAKVVTDTVRKSTTSVRRFVSRARLPISERLNTRDQVSFDITTFILNALRNHQGHYLVQAQPTTNLSALVNLCVMLCWLCSKNSCIKKPDFQIENELDLVSQERGIEFLQELVNTMGKISSSALANDGINLDLAMGHLAIYIVQLLRTTENQLRGSPESHRRSSHGTKRGLVEIQMGVIWDNPKKKDDVVRLPQNRRIAKPLRKSLPGQNKDKDPLAIKLFKY